MSETSGVPEPKPAIVYDDFAKLDMRIGRVLDVQPFPRARNPSYKVQVDLGPLGTRWSSAQITSYQPEDLVGKRIVCVVNFPPRNIAGFQSEVLILGAANPEGLVKVLGVQGEVELGMPVY